MSHVTASSIPIWNICSPKSTNVYDVVISALTSKNKLKQWAIDNGFRFSKTKTVCMHICQKRGLHLDPHIFLDKSPIPIGEESTFLGLYCTPY